MSTPHDTPERPTIPIREAFPALLEGQEAEAEARVVQYVALVFRIYERIREDPSKYAALQQRLTELSRRDSMNLSGTAQSPGQSS